VAATASAPSASQRVLVAGATGYIGRAVVAELVARGHRVVSLVRDPRAVALEGSLVRVAEVTDPVSLERDAFAGEAFDAVVSCLASRTGGAADAWRVDYQANRNLLAAAAPAGVGRFVLLSAICLQNPRLAFQHAKLAFEAELAGSGLGHAIVRPTAFFKSLAGQIPRLKAGKPFVLFGPGDGPACKPISERDLARFMADCLDRPDCRAGILPVGGPGPAVTPRERGEMLFEMLGRPPRFRRLPLVLFDMVEKPLSLLSTVTPALAERAEFPRIGRYYATEPMLWRDPETGAYDARATPAFGEDTLRDFYARVLEEGLAGQELGDQALF
jgi:divinyl chlorophyllide a 8-vinyl-reductase